MNYFNLHCLKLPWHKIQLSFVSAIALFIFLSIPIQVQAQSNHPATSKQQPQQKPPNEQKNKAADRFVPPIPPDLGSPGQREGAASRGGCPLMENPLTALVPVTKAASGEKQQGKLAKPAPEFVWSLTAAEHPTFLFYVPYSPPSLKSVEFALQDRDDNDVYRTYVKLPATSGIVSLNLPAASKPLLIGKPYHWFFKISCDPQTTSVPIFVEGWVQRVTPSSTLTSQLKTASPQQRIDLYATNGLWQDALTSLAELRLVNPDDANLKADWNKLLQSVGLADIASKPIVNCCTPAN